MEWLLRTNPVPTVAFVLFSTVLQIVASASIAIAWHRFALLGERPATIHLRFGRPEFRYALYSVLFAILLTLLIITCALASFIVTWGLGGLAMNSGIASFAMILALVVFFLTLPFVARTSLMLPAAAVDRPMGPLRALRFGKGFGWPMVFASICLMIPFLVLDIAIMMLITNIGSGLPQLFITIQVALLKGLEQIIATILLLSVMTITYAYAREQKEAISGETAE